MNDRRVHAVLMNGAEIVRYDRAGKYRIEPWGNRSHSGTMSLKTIKANIEAEGIKTWYVDVPGGTAFDKMVRQEYALYRKLHAIYASLQVRGRRAPFHGA